MSVKKKILIAVLMVLSVILVAVVAYVFLLLGRINYVPSSTQNNAQAVELPETPGDKPDYTNNLTPSPDLTSEDGEDAALNRSEIDLNAEVMQTELDEADKLALEQKDKKTVNILLIGVDRRGSTGNSRSDTMLIATIDQLNSRIKLTSIMRDLYIPIPGKGQNRINSACADGGPMLLIETINTNFSMNLEKYVMIDFKMFEKLVDSLDGITIDISKGEVAEANDCIAGLNKQRGKSLRSGFITKRGGDVKLTGTQALGYARIRHFGNGDYARTSRQFKVLQEIFKKFFSAGPVKQNQILMDTLPLVETNLTTPEILKLSVQALGVGNYDLMHYRLPVDGLYKAKSIRGMSVLLPDIQPNAQKLHWFISEATEIDALPNSDTKVGSYYAKNATPEPAQAEELLDPALNSAEPLIDAPALIDPDNPVLDGTIPEENAQNNAAEFQDESNAIPVIIETSPGAEPSENAKPSDLIQ